MKNLIEETSDFLPYEWLCIYYVHELLRLRVYFIIKSTLIEPTLTLMLSNSEVSINDSEYVSYLYVLYDLAGIVAHAKIWNVLMGRCRVT